MNKYDLSGKVAIVTGGAQGFGLAITKKFLDSGAEVIIWDIDKAATQKIVDQNKDKKISFKILDITKFDFKASRTFCSIASESRPATLYIFSGVS